eukprot:1161824-Pelagomonas_calceolata.AAC.9
MGTSKVTWSSLPYWHVHCHSLKQPALWAWVLATSPKAACFTGMRIVTAWSSLSFGHGQIGALCLTKLDYNQPMLDTHTHCSQACSHTHKHSGIHFHIHAQTHTHTHTHTYALSHPFPQTCTNVPVRHHYAIHALHAACKPPSTFAHAIAVDVCYSQASNLAAAAAAGCISAPLRTSGAAVPIHASTHSIPNTALPHSAACACEAALDSLALPDATFFSRIPHRHATTAAAGFLLLAFGPFRTPLLTLTLFQAPSF